MVFLARWTLGCPSGLAVAGGGSGPGAVAPWAPGILSSLIAKLWTDGGDFPAPVIDILARLGQAPPLLGEDGNDFVAWPEKHRQAGRRQDKREDKVRECPTSPPGSLASHPSGCGPHGGPHLPRDSRVHPQ